MVIVVRFRSNALLYIFMYPTDNYKHSKITIPLPWNKKSRWTVTYYIAKMADDKHLIHYRINNNMESDGYGGAILDFLMDDGSIEKVQGPFYEYPESHTRVFEYIREAEVDV